MILKSPTALAIADIVGNLLIGIGEKLVTKPVPVTRDDLINEITPNNVHEEIK